MSEIVLFAPQLNTHTRAHKYTFTAVELCRIQSINHDYGRDLIIIFYAEYEWRRNMRVQEV